MNKVILNGIDISEALEQAQELEKLLERATDFIAFIKQAEREYRTIGWECLNKGLEKEAQYHFGRADSCLATRNDLESILGEIK